MPSALPTSTPLISYDAALAVPLQALAQALERQAHAHHWPEATVYRVNLVLEELLQNIADHGSRVGPVAVWVSTQGNHVELSLRAPGPGIDPRHAPAANVDAHIDDAQPGGLGLLMVRKLCEIVAFTSSATEHSLILRMQRV